MDEAAPVNAGSRNRPGSRTERAAKKEADALALVAYCGLYCGDCFWRKGVVSRLAGELSAEIRSSGYDRYARYISRFPSGRKLKEFDRFEKVLCAMQVPGCARTCRDGGCDPKCGLRRCCLAQGYDGCWQCTRFERCQSLAELKPIHGDGYLRNLRTLRRRGSRQFARGPRFWATKRVVPAEGAARKRR
jgi:hypothetical protein